MKKNIWILILSFCAFTLNAQNLNDSLLLYYPFNGNANDSSGNSFHGTIVNAVPTTDNWGNPNSAYYFNGIDSHIDFPNQQQLKPQLPVSIAFNVKFDTLPAWNTQLFTTDYTLNSYFGIWFGLNPYTNQMQLSFGEGTYGCSGIDCRRTKQGTTVFQTGIWYFVVGIIRDSLDMSIYVNCRDDEGFYTGTGGNLAYSPNPGSLGRIDLSNSTPYYFKGSLDELRYWSRELSVTDLTSLCGIYTQLEDRSLACNTTVYPNPASNTLFLDTQLDCSYCKYEIKNILGETTISGHLQTGNRNEINISNLLPGIYFLTLKTKDQFQKIKFIKIYRN